MRITTQIAASAERSLTRMPFPRCQMEECLDPKTNKLDVVRAQMAFACDEGDDYHPFMAANTDDSLVYFAAFTFLELFHDAYHSMVLNSNDDSCYEINNSEGTAKPRDLRDEQLERKLDRDRFVFVRQDIRRVANGVKVKISMGNPYNVVGGSEREAVEYVSACAQLWLRIAEQVEWLTIEVDCPDRPNIIAEAAEKNRKAAVRREYADCERRAFGGGGKIRLCSPAKFDCPFYKNGRCEYEER